MGMRFFWWGDEMFWNVLELDSGDGCTTLQIANNH